MRESQPHRLAVLIPFPWRRVVTWLAAGGLLAYLMPAAAGIVVLVQGYLGSGNNWRESGVVDALQRGGWRDGGHLQPPLFGWPVPGAAHGRNERLVYTLLLPTEAPLLVQAQYLAQYLGLLWDWRPQERVILVGHSAGGVAARLAMVRDPAARITALITIASPHLGTQSAELGTLAGRSPLGWMAPFVGGDTLNRSQGLFQDLMRERPNSLLFWLNRQPHPPAHYIAIVRTQKGFFGHGDLLIPAWSQDMNNVSALRGQAVRIAVNRSHGLHPEDGRLLVDVLRWIEPTDGKRPVALND